MQYNKIKTPYGFSALQIGESLTVYTAKIRFANVNFSEVVPYLNVSYFENYCYLSFEVIDYKLAQQLWQKIGEFAFKNAQTKLNIKYNWVKNEIYEKRLLW